MRLKSGDIVVFHTTTLLFDIEGMWSRPPGHSIALVLTKMDPYVNSRLEDVARTLVLCEGQVGYVFADQLMIA